MTKNPIINALSAALYITVVASVMYYAPRLVGPAESVLVPIAILSLFVLSAAIMGYIFCYEPIQLFLENKKKEALNLFLKTVGVMGIITVAIFCVAFFLQ